MEGTTIMGPACRALNLSGPNAKQVLLLLQKWTFSWVPMLSLYEVCIQVADAYGKFLYTVQADGSWMWPQTKKTLISYCLPPLTNHYLFNWASFYQVRFKTIKLVYLPIPISPTIFHILLHA